MVYWRNEKFYFYNVLTDTEKFLIKDYSYDSGIQHQSYATIYFNDDFIFFNLLKAKLTGEEEYLFLYSIKEDKLMQVKRV